MTTNPSVLDLIGKQLRDTVFVLTDFFAVEMDNPAVQGDEIDDTTCTFSTNPRQPTGEPRVGRVPIRTPPVTPPSLRSRLI